MGQKGFVFECKCGQSVWCVSEYHRTQHLHSRNHKRALADQEREEIQNHNVVEQKAQEVLEVESLLVQRCKELEAVESQLSEAKNNLGNVEQERVAILNSAKEETQRIRAGAKAKADSAIEDLEAQKSAALREVERLKGVSREFQRLDQYQKSLASVRAMLSASESQMLTILKDLKLVSAFLQEFQNPNFYKYQSDERADSLRRLLALVKSEEGQRQ